MRDNRSYLQIKLAAAQRYAMWHYLSSYSNHIRVTEYPKSGGTWLCQMLSKLTNMPFPRNQMMTWSSGIQHSHYPGLIKNQKTILLVRDGRDIIVSAYYHFILGHDRNPSFLTQQWRALLDVKNPENIEEHLPRFLNIFFQHFKVGGRHMDWATYISSFDLDNPDLLVVKYEDLLSQGASELRRILQWLSISEISEEQINATIHQFSFETMTGRRPGTEDAQQFLRKGVVGDWKNHFRPEAIATFNNWAEAQLIQLGYEH